MLTTIMNSLTPGAESPAGQPLNLLPEGATEPVATFANELKLKGAFPLTPPPESGEWMAEPTDAERLLAAGESLPEAGNALPEQLRDIVRQLKELAFAGEEAGPEILPGTTPETRVPQALAETPEVVPEVVLPPGLSFLNEKLTDATPAEARRVLAQVMQGQIQPATAASQQAPTRPDLAAAPAVSTPNALKSLSPDSAQAALDQIARIARVPVERVDTALEQRDLSAADLKRLVDSINQRLRAVSEALPGTGSTASTGGQPIPAAVVRIDGQVMDSKLARFRTLGVGQPAAAAGPNPDLSAVSGTTADRSMPATQTRGDILMAEALRQESLRSELLRQDPQRLESLAVATGKPAAPVSQPAGVNHASALHPGAVQSQLAPESGGLRTLNDAIATPVRDPAWGERLGERVVMMANNKLQSVDIRLSPADLGPLRVKVSMEDGTASVSFVAQHSVTRDAIEQALPRLKAQLEESGIDLGNTSVDQQAPEQHAAESGGDDGRPAGDEDALADGRRDGGVDSAAGQARSDEQSASATDRQQRISRGLLDTFV